MHDLAEKQTSANLLCAYGWLGAEQNPQMKYCRVF